MQNIEKNIGKKIWENFVNRRKILSTMQETTIIKKTLENKLVNKNCKEMHNTQKIWLENLRKKRKWKWMKLLELCGANSTLYWKKKNAMYHDHGVLVTPLSALSMNKNMEAKTSRPPIDKKLIKYE